MVGYTSLSEDPLARNILGTINDLATFEREIETNNTGLNRIKSISDSDIEIKINGVSIDKINVIGTRTGMMKIKNVQDELFGKNVTFTFSRKASASGSGILPKDESVTMYVPEIVEIKSPLIQDVTQLLPNCYYKDFILQWNADPNNENGLVVVVEWNGVSVTGEKINEYVRNIDVLTNDNGNAILNNKLFDNIPQGGVANIMLIRGNIEILETIDFDTLSEEVKETFRIVAASSASLPMVMVKQI
ncbi:MAG: hypothetical protein ACK5KP_07270 [Paludibacteraceae bacterium]